MRILFDHNVPDNLKRSLAVHHVETSDQRGWERLKNGILLRTAERAGFEVVVTADQNIRYQQNLTGRRIALVVLGSNRWPFIQKYIPEIVAAVDAAGINGYPFIEIPQPRRPKRPLEES